MCWWCRCVVCGEPCGSPPETVLQQGRETAVMTCANTAATVRADGRDVRSAGIGLATPADEARTVQAVNGETPSRSGRRHRITRRVLGTPSLPIGKPAIVRVVERGPAVSVTNRSEGSPAEMPGPGIPPAPTGSLASHAQPCLVSEIARRASIPTWTEAVEATQATLCALAEWLDPPRRQALAHHLPTELATALDDAVRVSVGGDDLVALYRCAALHHPNGLSLHEIALRCAAVLAVLGEALPDAVIADIVEQLPADIAAVVPHPGADGNKPRARRPTWLARGPTR